MLRRIAFDVVALMLLFLAPWWIVLIYAIIGIILFSWYLEIIFLGLFFDVMYGGHMIVWYLRLVHTIIFTAPLALGEIIKRQINTR